LPISEFNSSYYKAVFISILISIILISAGLYFLVKFLRSLFKTHYSEILQSQILLKEQKEEIVIQNEEYKKINKELHFAREEAIENASFNEFLTQSIPFAIGIVDEEGTIQYLSENALKLLGNDAVGKKCWEVYRHDKTRCNDCPLKSNIAIGESKIIPNVNVIDNRIIDIFYTGIMYKGRKAFLEILVDVTERYRSLELSNMLKHSLDIYTDGIYWIDSKNTFVYVNEAGGKAFGCAPEDLLGKSLYEFNPTATPETVADLWFQLRTKGEFTTETVHRRADGSEFYVEIRTVYVQYDGKEYYNGYARDITQRKLNEKELINARIKAEDNERFLNISQKIGQIGSFVTEFPEGVWKNSPELYDILGITKEYPHNPDGFLELVHPDWRKEFELYYSNVIINKQRFDYSYKILRFNDKSERWVHGYGEFFTDAKTSSVKQIGTIQDITERKLAEEELIFSEERLRLLVENSEDMITILDFSGKYLFFSGPKKYNIHSRDVVGKTLYDLWDFDIASKIAEQINKIVQTGESSKMEIYVNFQGSLKWFEENIYPLKKENRIISVVKISSDISERKSKELELIHAKEKAEESDRLKTAFIHNLSHEIRTPMNAIMGFSELIGNNYNDKAKIDRFSTIINQRCNDLLVIISDLLDIAKIEANQLPVHIESCNLKALFSELSLFFEEQQKRLGKEHIKFNLKANCGPSESIILTDKVKLKQIFINLLSNSFKFTSTGSIEGGCKFNENQTLVFYLSDTGIGIPHNKQQLIFKPFTQAEQGTNRLYGGIGLGLSIVKGLINLLGGEIFLESEVGKGSTFTFTIPFKTTQLLNEEPFVLNESLNYNFQNQTILVVEDDLYNTEFIKELLSDTGLNIIYAAQGSLAMQLAASHIPDLVLMDIRLPDMNGYEVTRKLLQHNPNLKIIAQTAYAAKDDELKSKEAGCIDHISKPLKRKALFSMISKYLS